MMMRRLRAFTLIEVLVALAIFGVLSALAYVTLGQTLANADMLTTRMDRLQALQRTVTVLSTDLMQAAPRPIRDDFGDFQPAFISTLGSDFALQLTHGGWPNSTGVPRSTQQRTAYRVEDGELLRYHWNVLDRTASNVPVATVLLEGIDSLTFRFLQPNGDWSSQWPPLAQQSQASNSSLLPRAVEILIVTPEEGELRRVIEVSP